MNSDDVQYGLIVAFPDQSPSFVHGYEAGQIATEMQNRPSEIEKTVHAENKEILTRIALSQGYSVDFKNSGVNEYLFACFKKEKEVVARLNPHGLRIVK